MEDQNKNLILAIALSFLVILVWFVVFPPPEPEPVAQDPATAEQTAPGGTSTIVPGVADAAGTDAKPAASTPAVADLKAAPRITIDSDSLTGSISLLGGRIDDLSLKDYRVTQDPDSPIVRILTPADNDEYFYAVFGWAPGAGLDTAEVPGSTTLWQLEQGDKLTPQTPVVLAWDNGNGLTFRRQISIDDKFMFTIAQSVENRSGAEVSLAPYGLLARHGTDDDGEPAGIKNFFVLHEGLVGMADDKLAEIDYSDMRDFAVNNQWGGPTEITEVNNSGWIGFTDHFWMSTLIPTPGTPFKAVAKFDPRGQVYQTTAMMPTITLADGASATATSQLFSGAKEWEAIRAYEKAGVAGFIDSIDWGWFFFLTKPIFWLLHNLNQLIGNMGWSIIGLTLIIKAIVFPLAFKSYVSMARMKELQPQMEKLKEAAGDDRAKLQQGMMELYKKEKVNPASGCLPILIQIPIFFSLYKVIFVTIELRHAAWFGPFQDLSAPDPTSIMNLFGLLPNAGPEVGTLMATIFIGILPLLLGISMWLQQKLNPAPTDATQQMIFAWMPWVFMFMLGSFASGLVIYWIANNTITFAQQYAIMARHGKRPDLFDNIKKGFKRKPKPENKTAKK
jgi:YidC/Oxa1 family membrane protein insertase